MKSYDQPRQHIKKQRPLPTKVHLVKAMVFPVVMYRFEIWTIKKAEHQRIDAFELWCWRRLLRIPWTARRSKQSILKEISPEYSLGGLMLKLKLQYLGHLMWRNDSLEKTNAGKDWRQEEKGMTDGWRASPTWVWVSFRSWWWTGKPGVLQSMGSQRVGHDWATEIKTKYFDCFQNHRLDSHLSRCCRCVGDNLTKCFAWYNTHPWFFAWNDSFWLLLNQCHAFRYQHRWWWFSLTLVTPWAVVCQAPLPMRFFREYWSGLPFPPPGDLPNPGIEPWSPVW